MKDRKPFCDPNERIFTLSDIKLLIRSQKKKLLKASAIGACLAFGWALITFAPKYQICATFKESLNGNSSASQDNKMVAIIGGGSGTDSQTIMLMQSYPVLKPLVERMGVQVEVRNSRGLLSKVYRRVRDNLLAELSQELSDSDWFAFRNVAFSGEKAVSYSLRFDDPEHFSLLSGTKILASGALGSPIRLPVAEFTMVKTPSKLRLKYNYPLTIQNWISAVQSISSRTKIAEVKKQKSIYSLHLFHRDRYFGTELLNALMEEYRSYLKRDHDLLVQEQLVYLQEKQEEICGKMTTVFDEYTEYLQDNLKQKGQLGLKQELDWVTRHHYNMANRLMSLDLEFDRLCRMEDSKRYSGADDILLRKPNDILKEISDLQQQRDLIELSLPEGSRSFSELGYETKKGELKEIRDRVKTMQSFLHEVDRGELVSGKQLFDPESSLGAWAARLTYTQEDEREDLAEYIEKTVRLLSMQEKMVQEQICFGRDIPVEFRGIDLITARSLFVEYNNKLDQCDQGIGHFSRLSEEIADKNFEISSLSAVLPDPLSQRLIQNASETALKLKDEKHHSEKEGVRWEEELLLQKNILKGHLDQLMKVERLKSEMIHEKISALQAISLGCISGKISVLQEQFLDLIKNRKSALMAEKKILKEKMEGLVKGFSGLPEKWRREKWLNLKSQMGIKMVHALTDLVESKTIASHMHHIESKPLDFATVPIIPCKPGLLTKAFLGAFFAGFFILSRTVLRTILGGFPTSKDKLRAMSYPIIGEISPFCDGLSQEMLAGSDLEAIRQMSFFFDKPPKGKVIAILEGKGPDYSYALAEHSTRLSLRSLIVRCDFNMKFTQEDMPGLLQVWKKEAAELPIRRGSGYDVLMSGGYTPYGSEFIRSLPFQRLLEKVKSEYDYVFLVFRSPLDSAESLAPLSLCDKAIVTVLGEPTEQLTPFVDWAYHDSMCRIAFITSSENEK